MKSKSLILIFTVGAVALSSCGYRGYVTKGEKQAIQFPGPPNPPTNPPSLPKILTLAAGGAHTCALRTDGVVKCWGDNRKGQLGNGSTSPNFALPVSVQLPAKAVQLALGKEHSCALLDDQSLFCWGSNEFGNLGIGAQPSQIPQKNTPTAVTLSVLSVVAGDHHTCIMKAGYQVQCWGLNDQKQVGAPTTGTCGSSTCSVSPIGTQVSPHILSLRIGVVIYDFMAPGPHVVQLALGAKHSCAVYSAGFVMCWGSNTFGQGGAEPQTASRYDPRVVDGVGLGNQRVLAAGNQTCAQHPSLGLRCWGAQAAQTIPNPTAGIVPQGPPANTSGSVGFSLGADHGCSVGNTGVLHCWGWNDLGQLGRGSYVDPCNRSSVQTYCTTSVLTTAITNGVQVTAGDHHSCALHSDQKVSCWGSNAHSQVGSGTPQMKTPYPTLVDNIL